jgi:predicted double-glycine peptidase
MRSPVIRLAGLCLGMVGSLAVAATSGIWLDVPFVKQQKNGCGAACVSMVLQYWAKCDDSVKAGSATAVKVQQELYSPQAKGIFASDMKAYFQRSGFRAFEFEGEWSDLRQNLTKGRPLIVSLKANGATGPLHYVVVAGLDWEQDIVMVNDPALRKLLKLDRPRFEKDWAGTGHWTLLALPRKFN